MSKPLSLAQLVEPYKTGPASPTIAIIADRVEAKKLLAALLTWPLPRWKRPAGKAPTDPRERWLWLWDGFDGGWRRPLFLDEIANVAGLSEQAAAFIWPQLIGARAVYPDGTLSEDACKLLSAHFGSQLPKQQPIPVAREAKKKGDTSGTQRQGDTGTAASGSVALDERRADDGSEVRGSVDDGASGATDEGGRVRALGVLRRVRSDGTDREPASRRGVHGGQPRDQPRADVPIPDGGEIVDGSQPRDQADERLETEPG